MDAVAGDLAALQPLGQVQGEQHVAQLAVAVGGEELPAEPAGAKVLTLQQSLLTGRAAWLRA